MGKKLRVKGIQGRSDADTVVNRCLQTIDGYENVTINLDTGEVTYTDCTCFDEDILREALALENLELEKG